MTLPKIVTPEEFHKIVPGMSLPKIYRLAKKGDLPASQPGGHGSKWLINLDMFLIQFHEKQNNHEKQNKESGQDRSSKKCKDEERPNGPLPRWLKNVNQRRLDLDGQNTEDSMSTLPMDIKTP